MDYQDFKSFYQSNILLFIVLLFVLIYVVMNWNLISTGNYFGGDYIKTILITGIIFLISHMLITWDDTENQSNKVNNDDEIIIPKYKFQSGIENNQIKYNIPTYTGPNNTNQINTNQVFTNPPTIPNINLNPNPNPNLIPESKQVIPESLNNKYKVVNKFNLNPNNTNPTSKLENFINNYSNNDSKLSNQNIFISHRNSSKYGLKF